MSTISQQLVNNSLSAALSSIEIYNKPDFKYREEIFTVLIINAWELLLKAKIIKDADEDITSVYVIDKNNQYKTTRNGSIMTIEINRALNKLCINPMIKQNIEFLLEIRDSVIHFYHTQPLSYTLYTLAAASLQNYQKIMNQWFNKSLSEYNFYILPLGFFYNFKNISVIDISKEPESVANLITSVLNTQANLERENDFYFACEISTHIHKLDKTTSAHLSVAIDPEATDGIIIEHTVSYLEKFPLSFTDLYALLKKQKPSLKQSQIHDIIKKYNIKKDPKMSIYNFRTKSQKDEYVKKGILAKNVTSLYNDNAIRFITTHLEE